MTTELEATGRMSVARVTRAWYVLCESRELRAKPLRRTLYGWPLVLFRAEGGLPVTLLDRCPHRNVPLSDGRVVEGTLECPYHGWRFGAQGRCTTVPGLVETRGGGRDAPAHATVEQDGFVWAWAQAGETPTEPPPRVPTFGAGYSEVRRSVDFPGTLHATAENALDVPHTAFLHRGLFRGTGKRNHIEARIRRDARSTTATYHGEPRPDGLVARLLSPSGGEVEHFDRFELPGVAVVDYRIGSENHFRVTTYLTPLTETTTRAFAVLAFRLRVPHALVLPFLAPIAMRIFRQDAVILARQTDWIERFGGERFVSTEIDILGAQIWRLLERAAAGRSAEDETEWERRVQLYV
ncbi:MAG: hypothetical protein RIT45_3325 [Pseudomonadota bacterium]